MANTLGRRSLLKMVAGAIAGAVVANKVTDDVFAASPAPETHNIKGQVEAIKLAPVSSITTGTTASGAFYQTMYFPKGDQGQVLRINAGTFEWDCRLEPATDEPKLAYGWKNTLLIAESLYLTMDEVRERFTAEEVDFYASLIQNNAPTITIA